MNKKPSKTKTAATVIVTVLFPADGGVNYPKVLELTEADVASIRSLNGGRFVTLAEWAMECIQMEVEAMR